MLFEMPIGDDLRIEKINEGWFAIWDDEKLPLCCPNEPYAMALGIAAQWAAQKTMEKMDKFEKDIGEK